MFKVVLIICMVCPFFNNASEEKFLQFAQPKNAENREIFKELYQTFLKDLTPGEKPILFAIGGAPGAGKTTWRKWAHGQIKNIHLHDMDEVLIRLPGYQKDLALSGPKAVFEKWWPTAREIAEKLVQYAIESRYSIIYDRTCGAEGSYFQFLRAKKLGYQISMVGLCLDADQSYARVVEREKMTKRGMTREIVDEYRARFSALWPYYLSLVDEATLYETEKDQPRLIFSSQKGVVDPLRYASFLNEGVSFELFFQQKLRSDF